MKKINIVELLKDCPSGMELDSPIIDNLYFDHVTNDNITCYTISDLCGIHTTVYFKHDGSYISHSNAKCVIFPKGKTTWEGFQKPFKDGDILFIKATYSWILIYKDSENKKDMYKYAAIPVRPNDNYIVHDDNPLCHKKDISNIRFATEEEKEKLFKAIKDNGYKWNPETKTLEKLIVPKFKVGDKIRAKDSYKKYLTDGHISTITSIKDDKYWSGLFAIEHIEEQDDWELVPKFKVGDKVRGKYTKRIYTISNITPTGYKLSNGASYTFFDTETCYELVPNQFDISTLKPFESKVLVRTANKKWVAAFYSHYDKNSHLHYCVCGGLQYEQCIPYNDETKHLLDTFNDCDEYFKTWE